MSTSVAPEAVFTSQPVNSHLAEAARLLEQAIRAGSPDPQAPYLLAMCYKRQRRYAEARQTLHKIPEPDANVWLQLGLLAFAERDYPQAEQGFRQAWQSDPSFYAAAYNLLLTLLCQNQLLEGVALFPQLEPLAAQADERRFLSWLRALLGTSVGARGPAGPVPAASDGPGQRRPELAEMTQAEEERLLQLLAGLGPCEVAFPLLRQLVSLRPGSSRAQEVYLELMLLQGQQRLDRGQWQEAFELLLPLGRTVAAASKATRPVHVALLNFLGCCACLLQDHQQGVWYFTAALTKAGPDARLHQNLALAHEWLGRLDQAETHWNRYFDLLDPSLPMPSLPNYLEALAFEGLSRLADTCARQDRPTSAVSFLQRASRLRPQDVDVLDRLFHLFHQLKRPEETKRTLRRLRELRPNDPQFELYELDVREVRTLGDIERLLGDIRRTLHRHPNDLRVEEKAMALIGGVFPLMRRCSDQLADQLHRVEDQMRRLPNSQVNWTTAREVMRDLEEDFLQLRRLTNKCLQLVTSDDQRRFLHQLADYLERKIESCHALNG